MQVGDRVKTPDLGFATVLEIRAGKALVDLERLDGIKVSYGVDDLEKDGGSSRAAASTVETALKAAVPPRPTIGEAVNMASRSIQALRFGLIPRHALEQLTVDHDKLAKWIRSCLPHENEGGPTLSEVCGPFGTGKSHAMAVVREVAMDANYLIAQVEVDGNRVSMSDPERLLFALWPTLAGKGLVSATPLLDLYLAVAKKGVLPPKITTQGIDRVGENLRVLQILEQKGLTETYGHFLDAILSSSDTITPAEFFRQLLRDTGEYYGRFQRMISRTVADRPHDFIEVLLGHAIMAKLAGYAGLAITIDEFEIERQDRRRWEKTKAVLELIANYIAGRTDYPPAPLALFVASVGQEGHVGDDIIDQMIDYTSGERYELSPIRPSQRRWLAERLHAVYCEAYDLNEAFPEELYAGVERAVKGEEETESGLIRAFIKAFIGNCDAVYGPPKRASAG